MVWYSKEMEKELESTPPNNNPNRNQYFLNRIDSRRKKVFAWSCAIGIIFFFGGMVLFGLIFGFNSKGTMWELDVLMIPLLIAIYGIGYLFGGKKGGLVTSGFFIVTLIAAALHLL